MRRSADFVFGINQLVVLFKRSASLDEREQMSTAKAVPHSSRFTLWAIGSSLEAAVVVGGIWAME
jgi:hypothetical protein